MTKTVDGMCADCWGVKDPVRARRWLLTPRATPRFDPVVLLWLVGAVVAVVLVVLFLGTGWI